MDFILYTLSEPVPCTFIFICGLVLALCGFMGNTRPVKSIGLAVLVFLSFGFPLTGFIFGVNSHRLGDLSKYTLIPIFTALLIMAPILFFGLHLSWLSKKNRPTIIINRMWLLTTLKASGILLMCLSIPAIANALLPLIMV